MKVKESAIYDGKLSIEVDEVLQKRASELFGYTPTPEEIMNSVDECKKREDFLLESLIEAYYIWVK